MDRSIYHHRSGNENSEAEKCSLQLSSKFIRLLTRFIQISNNTCAWLRTDAQGDGLGVGRGGTFAEDSDVEPGGAVADAEADGFGFTRCEFV
jgi:hypothetical protein